MEKPKILLPEKQCETYVFNVEGHKDFFCELNVSYENAFFTIKPSQKTNLNFNSALCIQQYKIMQELISEAIKKGESLIKPDGSDRPAFDPNYTS